jgi:hypothetical protein
MIKGYLKNASIKEMGSCPFLDSRCNKYGHKEDKKHEWGILPGSPSLGMANWPSYPSVFTIGLC